ncbi:MAG: ABC transporter permease [Deltaproteobacteria bacterium]|nr:ABC transporter permease [Deltaproteobacteria bacterium]
MNLGGVLSIARKEIRSHFLSPVAVIFLGVFLLVTLFTFFTQSRFFIRGIADVRPLFEWMPLLLIFLVSAVTMRQWSEEQKMGTLEVLLTLPLKTSELVLGKFLASLGLVALALALTLPIPLTVADLGPLDSGPVIGGYVAALLLASAYLAAGLWVSALSDNQIVSLMLTMVLCGALYFVGSSTLLGFVGQDAQELLAALGSGSRFLSVERGVLDLRDLAYYLSLTGLFLSLNALAIERKRMELAPADRPSSWRAARLAAVLFGLNLVAGNALLHDARPGRLDLTEDQLYSVSDVTVEVLEGLDERLEVTGYFSERTHPLLAPLVPQIKDLLKEYQARGGERLKVEFVDPHANEDLEEELGATYGIRSIPISVAGRAEMSFVNAYFHVLLRYGDEHVVLGFEDLVDVRRDHSNDGVELQLKGLEYALTKAVKAVSSEFLSLDALMASQPIKLTGYITPAEQLPEALRELPARLTRTFEDLKARAAASGGALEFSLVDPAALTAEQRAQLAERHDFNPFRLDLLDAREYYAYGLIEVGKKQEGLMLLQKDLSAENLTRLVETAIRRSAPGFKKTVGLLTKNETEEHPAMPYGQEPPPPKSDYRQLEKVLGAEFEVRRLELKDELVPADIDVLLVAKPGALSPNQQFAIDQYLMGGGTVLALAGRAEIEPEFMPNSNGQVPPTFKAEPLDASLPRLLSAYGVRVGEGRVADPRSLDIVYPVSRGFNRVQITQAPYPFFNQVSRGDFPSDHVILSGLSSLTVMWPAPLTLEGVAEGVAARPLLFSSEESWVSASDDLSPSVARGEAKVGRQLLAATLEGPFKSPFADMKAAPAPQEGEARQEGDAPLAVEPPSLKVELDKTGRTLKSAVAGAKLAVIGAPDLVSDLGLGVGNYYTGLFGLRGDYEASLLMFQNVVEWAVEDDSLAAIRTGGAAARVLRSTTPEEQRAYELVNYGVALAALVALTLLATLPRRLSARAA